MIILYGPLRKAFGKEVNCIVHSVTELVRAVEANRPGFLSAIKRDRQYIVRRGSDFRKGKNVPEEEIDMRFSDDTWHVLPMPAGSSGAARLIGGLLIMAGGVIYGAYTQDWATASKAIMFGAAVALGGISSLIVGVPKIPSGDDGVEENASYLSNGTVNNTNAGGAVTLLYGFDFYTGSTLLTGSLATGDVIQGDESYIEDYIPWG